MSRVSLQWRDAPVAEAAVKAAGVMRADLARKTDGAAGELLAAWTSAAAGRGFSINSAGTVTDLANIGAAFLLGELKAPAGAPPDQASPPAPSKIPTFAPRRTFE